MGFDYLHQIGDACYKYRTARSRTVREAAKEIGISAATYNRVELAEEDYCDNCKAAIPLWNALKAARYELGRSRRKLIKVLYKGQD